MKSVIRYFCPILATMFIISCNKDSETTKHLDINELQSRWVLDRIIHKETGYVDSLIGIGTLHFHDSNCVSIKGQCRIAPGKFILNGNDVTISILSIMKPDQEYYERYCASNRYNSPRYDSIFFNNLNGNYKIVEDKLIISSNNGFNMEFKKSNLDYSFSCFDEEKDLVIDSVPKNRYYDIEIFKADDTLIYGKWMFVQSIGGIAGGEYKPTSDYFEAKKHGIYGVIKNDSLISYGKINIEEKTDDYLFIKLEPDTNYTYRVGIRRWNYVEHYGSNILILNEGCCDNFIKYFIRKK
jgi:hypothetical protein